MQKNDLTATIDTQVVLPCAEGKEASPSLVTTFNNLADQKEHFALLYQVDTDDLPLVRIHSECMTGDTFGSLLCDCGPQLDYARMAISNHGGAILYMRQEGRGIGFNNKMKAYDLKANEGLDTYEANRRLGFHDDLRDYTPAAQMLRALNMPRIKLLTNNPDKVSQITEQGIIVSEVVRTPTFETPENHDYLECKKCKTHHTLDVT